MNKLNIQLSGGLGNQLFQYATGRAISIEQNIPLSIDAWSGFVRDTKYQRKFELSRLSISYTQSGLIETAALWFYRAWTSKSPKDSVSLIRHKCYGNFYSELDFIFYPEILSHKITRLTWLIGYWQSPRYFNKYDSLLRKELFPPIPGDRIILDMGSLMQGSDAVALGLRIYEESVNPASHARTGEVKSAQEVNDAIRRLTERVPNARFFIFCTHRASLLRHLNLPSNTVFVTAEDGFVDSIDCLWLLTQCKHHIFTNSSFYWWGAWLSEAVHPNTEQLIYAADNFINADGLCDHWHRF